MLVFQLVFWFGLVALSLWHDRILPPKMWWATGWITGWWSLGLLTEIFKLYGGQ